MTTSKDVPDLDDLIGASIQTPGVILNPEFGIGTRVSKVIQRKNNGTIQEIELFVETKVTASPSDPLTGYTQDEVEQISGVMIMDVVDIHNGTKQIIGRYLTEDEFIQTHLTDKVTQINLSRWFSLVREKAVFEDETLEQMSLLYSGKDEETQVPKRVLC